jgi:hypothetical protein
LRGAGTLGGFVIDNDFGGLCGISARHVIASSSVSSVVSGDPIFQPEGGAAGSRQVGSLMRASNDLDAAIFALDPTASTETAIVEIGNISGKAESVKIQDPIRKRGRTTGLTFGIVQNAFSQMFGPFKGLSLEIFGVTPTPLLFCANGDSGSLIVNANNQVAGLLVFGGKVPTTGVSQPGFISGWAIDIDAICSSLRISV